MTKHTEVMKLAQELRALADRFSEGWYEGIKIDASDIVLLSDAAEALAEQPAPVQQEPVSDRENAIIRFALHQFMSNAYSHMNAAAQDKDSRHYTVSAVEKFAKDAKDAEALLSRLQFKAPQPAQRTWVGLTDEDIKEAEWLLSAIKEHEAYTLQEQLLVEGVDVFARAIEAKLREKNT